MACTSAVSDDTSIRDYWLGVTRQDRSLNRRAGAPAPLPHHGSIPVPIIVHTFIDESGTFQPAPPARPNERATIGKEEMLTKNLL
jgi:hypothetical protein